MGGLRNRVDVAISAAVLARRLAPDLNSALLVRLISVARVIHEMHSDAQGGTQIPDFPHALLKTATRILSGCSDVHEGQCALGRL